MRVRDEDVTRMNVLVNVSHRMDVRDRLQHALRDGVNPEIRLQFWPLDQLGELLIAAFNDEVECIAILERVVYKGDVGMTQGLKMSSPKKCLHQGCGENVYAAW